MLEPSEAGSQIPPCRLFLYYLILFNLAEVPETGYCQGKTDYFGLQL
jgi:hypothetical protein